MDFTAPSLIALAAAVVALVVAFMCLRRRPAAGAAELALVMCAVFIWALCSGLSSAATGMDTRMLFSSLSYLGSSNVSPLFLLFALRFRSQRWKARWWELAALWVIPTITVALAATYRLHELIWTGVTPGPSGSNLMVYHHGPWFYVAVAYHATLACAAALIVLRAAWRAQRMFVWQTAILITGLVIPWIFSAIYILPISPFPGLDLPPIGFAITGPLLIAGMRRFKLLDVVPVARHFLVESMADGVLVLDAWDRVVDINPAARALIGGANVIGRRVGEVQGPLGEAIAGVRARGLDRVETSFPGDPGRYVEVRMSPLRDEDGSTSGRVVVIRDLSERRAMEVEREKLITELQEALGDVKTLRGLLPICSSCKKIRDDKGSWAGLERYIMDHSDAQFSHGLCPECVARLYPDLSK